MKKRILMLSPYFPYPPHDGGKVRMYNLIKHLAATNDIYLLSYVHPAESEKNIVKMKAYCKEVYVVPREDQERIIEEDIPRTVSFFYTQKMINTLHKVLHVVQPDIIQIDFLIMTRYIQHIQGIPVIYTEHDMSMINFEKSFHDRDLPEKERFIEWNRLMAYAKHIVPKFEGVIVLTEQDRELLQGFLPHNNTCLIPTGVDITYYKPNMYHTNEKNLLYVGHYKHYPNLDAMCYFSEKIFPFIISEIPEAKLFVVGSGMCTKLQELNSKHIAVIGEVDDTREYFNKSSVFIAPIRLGGGIKGKILEAMACEVPVIAINEACQGIMCTPNKDIVVAENAMDFAKKTILLLHDDQYRDYIALHARKLVEKHYDWCAIAEKLNSFYLDTLH